MTTTILEDFSWKIFYFRIINLFSTAPPLSFRFLWFSFLQQWLAFFYCTMMFYPAPDDDGDDQIMIMMLVAMNIMTP